MPDIYIESKSRYAGKVVDDESVQTGILNDSCQAEYRHYNCLGSIRIQHSCFSVMKEGQGMLACTGLHLLDKTGNVVSK